MEMDLVKKRYRDWNELHLYCHRAAGVVGQLSASIFGYTNPKTRDYAEKLGLAFQLTNIIRDVGEDARRDRVYLPESELAEFKLTAQDILRLEYSPQFIALMDAQTKRAQALYDEAFALLAPEDRRAQRAGLIMAAIYRTLLDEIARDRFQVLHQRTSLTPIRKLWLAWITWVRN
jgi:phytoene synthase